MDALRLGILGGGINSAIGKVHLVASQLDGHWNVVGGAFSRDQAINNLTANSWGVKNCYRDLDDICNHAEDFDAVCVLTPTPSHYHHVSRLLNSGINVICEKSLTSDSHLASELIDLSEKTGKRLFTTYNYSGYAMVREIQHQIKGGELGDLLHIRIEMPQEGFIKTLPNGEIPEVQDWRKIDEGLPTLSLDLGVHTQHLSYFITGERIDSLVSHSGHKGWNNGTVDFVETLAKYKNGLTGSFFFGKAFLGNRNGLKVFVYGSNSSLIWIQTRPDELIKSSKDGKIEILDYASPGLLEANKQRYQRFKPGHPTGFIEAFANVYKDIADSFLLPSSEFAEHIFHPMEARMDLVELEAMQVSSKNQSWISV